MKFAIKQNATAPSLEICVYEDRAPKDLTGATAVFSMQDEDGNVVLDEVEADASDAADGKFRYKWELADTADVGRFQAEFKITAATGEVYTLPRDEYITVLITQEL